MNLFIPRVRLRSSQLPRWTTPPLRHLLKCAKTLRKSYSHHPTPAKQLKLSEMENSLQQAILKAKSDYEDNLLDKSSGSQVFRYIRSLKQSGDIPSTVYLGSRQASSSLDKAALFNCFFHSVFTESSFQLPDMDSLDPALCDFVIRDEDVYRVLSTLDTSKAKGIDGIGPDLLKHCADALYAPLSHLFRCTLEHHQLPVEWRLHKITPMHKSGDKSSVDNYRPISLLCSVLKVLEKLICDACSEFLSNSISPYQFGFTKNRSSTQQLLLFYHQIFESLRSGTQTDIIFLDFAKAFDSVPHASGTIVQVKTDRHWWQSVELVFCVPH